MGSEKVGGNKMKNAEWALVDWSKTDEVISAELGCNQNTVYLARYRVHCNPNPNKDREMLRNWLVTTGTTQAALARRLRVPV